MCEYEARAPHLSRTFAMFEQLTACLNCLWQLESDSICLISCRSMDYRWMGFVLVLLTVCLHDRERACGKNNG